MAQGVNDGDVGVDLDGLVVEKRRLVAPLLDGAERGLNKHRITGDDFQRFDVTVCSDDCLQFNAPFAVNGFGEERVDRLNAINKPCGLDTRADLNGSWLDVISNFWRRWVAVSHEVIGQNIPFAIR